eukprot:augustus_masked-scaffold_8-processed-gene-7.6-mRNA-1 protein AED:1.00 eAED:1.00 QI:0/-1/0/0/-1/1/1/0/274
MEENLHKSVSQELSTELDVNNLYTAKIADLSPGEKSKIAQLIRQLGVVTQEFEKIKSTRHQQEEQLKKIKKELQRHVNCFKQKRAKFRKLREKSLDLQVENKVLRNQVADLTAKNKDLASKYEKERQKCSNLQINIKGLEHSREQHQTRNSKQSIPNLLEREAIRFKELLEQEKAAQAVSTETFGVEREIRIRLNQAALQEVENIKLRIARGISHETVQNSNLNTNQVAQETQTDALCLCLDGKNGEQPKQKTVQFRACAARTQKLLEIIEKIS